MRSEAQVAPYVNKTQTIEATVKKWKALQLIGVALVLLGVMTCSGGFGMGSGEISEGGGRISPLLFLAGLVLVVIGRFSAWWYHK